MAFIFCDESVETGLEPAQVHRLLKELAVGEEGPHLRALLAGRPRHADVEKRTHDHPDIKPCDETKSKYCFACGYNGSIN